MKFSDSLQYPMPPEDVERMSLDPVFLRSRFAALGLDPEIHVEGRTIHARAHLDPALLPPAARAFVSADVRLCFREEWGDEGGALQARSTLEVLGAPVQVTMFSLFIAQDAYTSRSLEGDLSVKVPFFGGRIEKEAVSHLSDLLKAETQLAQMWLTTRGASRDLTAESHYD